MDGRGHRRGAGGDATPPAGTGTAAPGVARVGGARDPLVGRTVAGYTIVERLARGGLSAVYRGENGAGEVAAVKVLDPLYADLPALRHRFSREAEVAERLDGQGAPRLLGEGEVLGRPCLLFELIEGDRLVDRMARGGLTPEEAIALVTEVLGALGPAHALGIFHLDVKPANVMLARGGGVRLLDFSSAPLGRGGVAAGADTEPLGTPAYASPEQVDGRDVDGRSDLYAVGVLLFELLAGRRPFRGDPVQVLRGHAETPAPPIRTLRPELSVPLEAVVARALGKTPAARFPDVATMIAALRATDEARAGDEAGGADTDTDIDTDPDGDIDTDATAVGVPARPRPTERGS